MKKLRELAVDEEFQMYTLIKSADVRMANVVGVIKHPL